MNAERNGEIWGCSYTNHMQSVSSHVSIGRGAIGWDSVVKRHSFFALLFTIRVQVMISLFLYWFSFSEEAYLRSHHALSQAE